MTTPSHDEEILQQKIIEQVFAHARSIPAGRVIAYGALGALCTPPISGYICGRIMNQTLDDVPWWRVVAKDGSLPIAKRNPTLAKEQRDKLAAEGVTFDDEGRIPMSEFAMK
jgi:methylated-DNA-protein-cysteine methyltransferase-like protein